MKSWCACRRFALAMVGMGFASLVISLADVRAQEVETEVKLIDSEEPVPQIESPEHRVRLDLTVAEAPIPSLKYQLVPPYIDRKPGNAVVWYGKVKAEQDAFFRSEEVTELMYDMMSMPLEEMVDDPAVAIVAGNDVVYGFLRHAARSESCDWQLPTRETQFFSILLPEVQQTRTFARILAVRARLQIANGDFDGAVESIQTAIALGKNVASAPTLVNGLVGIAIFQIHLEQMMEMSQQPDSPNLYWALTSMPRPLISMRTGLDAEMDALRLSMPALMELDNDDFGHEYWQNAMKETMQVLIAMTGSGIELEFQPDASDAGVALMAARAYPLAKESLIAQGWDADVVEAMPIGRVILLRSMQQFDIVRDHWFRYQELPYHVAVGETSRDVDEVLEQYGEGPEIIPFATVFLPAINAVIAARSRSEQTIDMFRVVEAIRIYGANHDGALPSTLDDISEVPIPMDPVSGQPFDYSVEEGVAVLKGTPLPGRQLVYEIRIQDE